MPPLNYLMCVVLLTGSPNDVSSNSYSDPEMRAALKKFAVSQEVLDPHETGHFLKDADSFADNVKVLRERHAELEDCPPLRDHMMFVERDLINDLLVFNSSYRTNLQQRASLCPVYEQDFHAAIREAESLYKTWDILRDAKCEFYYVLVRRRALRELKKVLGDKAYYEGRMPPHVPIWRFQKID